MFLQIEFVVLRCYHRDFPILDRRRGDQVFQAKNHTDLHPFRGRVHDKNYSIDFLFTQNAITEPVYDSLPWSDQANAALLTFSPLPSLGPPAD